MTNLKKPTFRVLGVVLLLLFPCLFLINKYGGSRRKWTTIEMFLKEPDTTNISVLLEKIDAVSSVSPKEPGFFQSRSNWQTVAYEVSINNYLKNCYLQKGGDFPHLETLGQAYEQLQQDIQFKNTGVTASITKVHTLRADQSTMLKESLTWQPIVDTLVFTDDAGNIIGWQFVGIL